MNLFTAPLHRSTSLRRSTLAVAAVGLSMIALSACGSSEPAPAPPAAAPTSAAPSPMMTPSASSAVPSSAAPSSSAPSSSAPSSAAPSASATTATLLAAAATARGAVDGGRVVSVEWEDNSTWEVHLVTSNGGEQQVRISANGEEITSGPTDDRPDNDDRRENRALYGVDVDYREAVRIAQREVDGAQVRELTLDADDNRNEWEVDLRTSSSQVTLTLNADNGNVIERDNDD